MTRKCICNYKHCAGVRASGDACMKQLVDKTRGEMKGSGVRLYELYNMILSTLDNVLFVKNGYLFLKHLIPFLIAALLLLMLSVPGDNLLVQLVNRLEGSKGARIAAAIVTVVATAIYVSSVNAEIRTAYLWKRHDFVRTIFTSVFYVALCTGLSFFVLRSFRAQDVSLEGLWACYLIAILSLTGVGWSLPSKWVESIGVKSPNYERGRIAAGNICKILNEMRGKAFSTSADVKAFTQIMKDLQANINENIEIEPSWSRGELEHVETEIDRLLTETKVWFPIDNKTRVELFANACRSEGVYFSNFVNCLESLGRYWQDWLPKDLKRSEIHE
jgi:hypothetical protein